MMSIKVRWMRDAGIWYLVTSRKMLPQLSLARVYNVRNVHFPRTIEAAIQYSSSGDWAFFTGQSIKQMKAVVERELGIKRRKAKRRTP